MYEIILGIVIGAIVSNLFHYFVCGLGVLEIDHSNPEKDTYNFLIDDLNKLNNKKRFILMVKHHGSNTRN